MIFCGLPRRLYTWGASLACECAKYLWILLVGSVILYTRRLQILGVDKWCTRMCCVEMRVGYSGETDEIHHKMLRWTVFPQVGMCRRSCVSYLWENRHIRRLKLQSTRLRRGFIRVLTPSCPQICPLDLSKAVFFQFFPPFPSNGRLKLSLNKYWSLCENFLLDGVQPFFFYREAGAD